MAHVDVAQVGGLGDPITLPATVQVAMVGVVGAPWDPLPLDPAIVQVSSVGVIAPTQDAPVAVPALVHVAMLGVLAPAGDPPPAPVATIMVALVGVVGVPWAPPTEDDDATLYLIGADGVWRASELVPL